MIQIDIFKGLPIQDQLVISCVQLGTTEVDLERNILPDDISTKYVLRRKAAILATLP